MIAFARPGGISSNLLIMGQRMSENNLSFNQLSPEQRLAYLAEISGLTQGDLAPFKSVGALSIDQADHMIENAIGTFQLPLGIARHFLIEGREVPIPMAIEEPSVIAGASFMAKLARAGGGFRTDCDLPEMIGQIQILDLKEPGKARETLLSHKNELLEEAARCDPTLMGLGGGPRDVEVRVVDSPVLGSFLVLHLIMDVRDAMGANMVNTAVERLAPLTENLTGGRAHLRILSNLADRRLARSTCTYTRSNWLLGSTLRKRSEMALLKPGHSRKPTPTGQPPITRAY